ncbi:MAG: prephenate dehydrogenase/arogenate dehydrogenase family protein, partial [Candidatus Competibacteraceae bacterium]|nr:prephenate dehydrogenase/arogenate dehydrogenase family protein [Candidatus Competibacteraceae bacterium]
MKRIERLTIIGVGLIGGSLARALRAAAVVGEIVGAGRRSEPLERAMELGVIDRWDTDLPRAVAGADMVLVAVPLGAIFKVIAAVADHLPEGCILTDAGSAKGCVVEDVRRVFGRVPPRFVPGHPIAGTEKSGVEASFAELYRDRRVILTPLAETEAEAHEKVRWMW